MLYVVMSIYEKDKFTFLKEAIDSILKQTCTSFRVYILYDGIVSLKIDEYLSFLDDKRIKVKKRSINLGLAKSLNELLNEILSFSDCNFIARMDADDVSHPDRFKKQLDYLKEHENVECLGSWAIEINEDGSEYYRKKMPESHEDCLTLFKKRDCLIHPSVMFRRSYFDKAGLYPEDTYFGEDTIMWAQGFAAGCRFANIPEYLLKFRLDSDFFERRRGIKHAKSILSLRKRVNKMLGFGPKEYVYSYLYALAKLMPTGILNIIYKVFR